VYSRDTGRGNSREWGGGLQSRDSRSSRPEGGGGGSPQGVRADG